VAATVGWTVAYPPGWTPRAPVPLCLVLHGYATDHRYAFDTLHLQDIQAQLAQQTPARPFVLAAADGGNAYWHRRRDGDDPPGMLMDELVPRLVRDGISTDRLVAFGWSMGGYGSLLLAEAYPRRIARVAVESPAIWPSYQASQGANFTAFDSAVDWRDHDVIARLPEMGDTPVHVACGLSDPFLPASRRLEALLPAGDVDLAPGGHDAGFWQAHAPTLLAFVASS
jgi:enterochelin esterase-like enzyme